MRLTIAYELFQFTESRIINTIEHEIAHILLGHPQIRTLLHKIINPEYEKKNDEAFRQIISDFYFEHSRIAEIIADNFCPLLCKESMKHALRSYSLCSWKILLWLNIPLQGFLAILPKQEEGTHPSQSLRYMTLAKCNKLTWNIPWYQWQPYALRCWFNGIKRTRIWFRMYAGFVGENLI